MSQSNNSDAAAVNGLAHALSRRALLQALLGGAGISALEGCGGGGGGSGTNGGGGGGNPVPSPGSLNQRAYQFLKDTQDLYHKTFDVYTDADSAGNHFDARALIASAGDEAAVIPMNEAFADDAGSGYTCLQCKFHATGNNWGGWIMQNGVLGTGATAPSLNWGTAPNAGFDLRGATQLTFWAKGAQGGEKVQFFCLGIGRDPDTGAPMPNTPYPDSSPKISSPVITLGAVWQRYVIDLSGADLSYVLGGFGWVATSQNNGNKDVTFYLDNIQYDLARPNALRLLLSYRTKAPTTSFDMTQKDVAYIYDSCVALMAFIAANDLPRAKMLADAIVYAQQNDRYYTDGRIRNAYQAGDLVLFPGWTPSGKAGTARMPGFTDRTVGHFVEDQFAVSTSAGNMAWCMLALLAHYHAAGGQTYLDAAMKMGDWIETNCKDTRPHTAGGYMGGYQGWEMNTTLLTYKATEHNIDYYAACMEIFKITNDAKWSARAAYALQFIATMWSAADGHFWTGTGLDGITVNQNPIPVDIQVWSLEALLANGKQYWSTLAYVEKNHRFPGTDGYGFNINSNGVWREGTAQVGLAYYLTGDSADWQRIVQYLQSVQDPTNGGVPAANIDGLITGINLTQTIPWLYYNRVHVGATGWLVLTQMGYDPFSPGAAPISRAVLPAVRPHVVSGTVHPR